METDLTDQTCVSSVAKVGPDDDESPGGCDNVLVTMDGGTQIVATYNRLAA